MKCANCRKRIPSDVTSCPHCNRPVIPPLSQQAHDEVRHIFERMPSEVRDNLMSAFFRSQMRDEFIAQVMVGPCPKCNSDATHDCEHDPDVLDICVGRCKSCGQLWCLECRRLFALGQRICVCHAT